MEDTSSNRLQESLTVFDEVTKHPAFKETPVFLFLNKKDLFEELIRDIPFGNAPFEDYVGDRHDMQASLEYIKQRYRTIFDENIPGGRLQIFIVAAR